MLLFPNVLTVVEATLPRDAVQCCLVDIGVDPSSEYPVEVVETVESVAIWFGIDAVDDLGY